MFQLTSHNILLHETNEASHHVEYTTEGRTEKLSQHHCTSLHQKGSHLKGQKNPIILDNLINHLKAKMTYL